MPMKSKIFSPTRQPAWAQELEFADEQVIIHTANTQICLPYTQTSLHVTLVLDLSVSLRHNHARYHKMDWQTLRKDAYVSHLIWHFKTPQLEHEIAHSTNENSLFQVVKEHFPFAHFSYSFQNEEASEEQALLAKRLSNQLDRLVKGEKIPFSNRTIILLFVIGIILSSGTDLFGWWLLRQGTLSDPIILGFLCFAFLMELLSVFLTIAAVYAFCKK